jgi:hypothetical protein
MSSGHDVIRSWRHQVMMSSGHDVIRSWRHQVTMSSGHNVIRSQRHQVTTSLGHDVIRSRPLSSRGDLIVPNFFFLKFKIFHFLIVPNRNNDKFWHWTLCKTSCKTQTVRQLPMRLWVSWCMKMNQIKGIQREHKEMNRFSPSPAI